MNQPPPVQSDPSNPAPHQAQPYAGKQSVKQYLDMQMLLILYRKLGLKTYN